MRERVGRGERGEGGGGETERGVGKVNFTSTVFYTVLVKTSFLSALLTIIFPL